MKLSADMSLAQRFEAAEAGAAAAYVAALARLDPARGAAALTVAGGCAAFAGAGSPLSYATGLGMAGPVACAEVDRLEAFYRDRSVPAQVQLCPIADASLLTALGERGYRPVQFLNVLARRITRDGLAAAPSGGIAIARAGPAEEEEWVRTVARGFAARDDVGSDSLDIQRPSFHMEGSACFLARVGGESAGGGAVRVAGGVALLFAASTRPAFRGRGVQAALIGARLAWAAGAGCDLAMVRTVPGSPSQRNVERAGFQVVYTKVTLLREW